MSGGLEVSVVKLPLTHPLSPRAGRGDGGSAPLRSGSGRKESGAVSAFAPLAGRRWPAGRMRGSNSLSWGR
ncbi:hypothetical protein ABIA16_001609 [Sinorhizobium fredii]